ncbi:MAG: hypothetical protein US49_C0006G0001 [candidate division TM6 bacterium GW2011_GWF2_37_49]|nr:MAG: hypothetical protein US49_C0006G0001 [candidate division TM6 bacterium GW2011_GWF2_37_49]
MKNLKKLLIVGLAALTFSAAAMDADTQAAPAVVDDTQQVDMQFVVDTQQTEEVATTSKEAIEFEKLINDRTYVSKC